MANQKINVDIEITSDALNQLPKYKAGFDSLREAVNNLNKEIVNSTDKLNKLNAESKTTESLNLKVRDSVKNLVDTYETCQKAIEAVTAVLKGGWQTALSAAFSLITNYGPQILEFLGDMFNSERTKEAAKNIRNYNEMMAEYTKNVSGGMAQAQILFGIAKNENENWNNRVEAIKKLNRLAPEYLKNLNMQNVNTKEGRALMDEYTKSLKRAAMVEASQAQSKPVIEKKLPIEREIQRLNKKIQDYESGKAKNETHQIRSSGSGAGPGIVVGSFTDKDSAEKLRKEKVKELEKLNRELAGIQHNVNQEIVQYVAKPVVDKTQNKEYWENELARQQELLNKLDTASKNFKTQAKPIKNSIAQAQKMLALYENAPQTKISIKTPKPAKPTGPTEEEIRKESADRMALMMLDGYAREIAETNLHFDKLIKAHQHNAKTVEQLNLERVTTLANINKKFQEEDLVRLNEYQNQLNESSKTDRQKALDQVKNDYAKKSSEVQKIQEDNEKIAANLQNEMLDLLGRDPRKLTQEQIEANNEKVAQLEKLKNKAEQAVAQAKVVSEKLKSAETKDTNKLQTGFNNEDKRSALEDNIAGDQASGNFQQEFLHKKALLDLETKQAVEAAKGQTGAIEKIKKDAKDKQDQLDKARMDAEVANQKKYVQGLDKMAGAVSAIFGKNTIAARLAFKAHQAAAAAQVIIDTRQAIMGIWKANAGLPFIGTAKAIAETAIVAATGASNLATIMKQKPGFAQGGQYTSDGRGALLHGYSRTDNTNAYLRSGEAVVVSEAMRNPWARNLVSAINVAYGGRDFSIPNTGSGYAIGGVFTDGGNASRYYSQPMNDQKDLANTLAYQMLNNFPPIYVDVKDVNNQQNILAQTVNRVNL